MNAHGKIALAALLTIGVLLTIISRGVATTPAHLTDDPIAVLVEQLGTSEFSDRELAEKKLLGLGTKAKPALRAGLKSESPEVRQRVSRILAVIRRDQIWAAFKKVVGDDKNAQELFAKLMGSQRGANAIETVLDDPMQADEVYRTRTAELMRIAYGHPPVD